MKTALSLNDCARRLRAHPRGVQSPRFDLFVDCTRPERSKGRLGQTISALPDECLGQPLPDARRILILIGARFGTGAPSISEFFAS